MVDARTICRSVRLEFCRLQCVWLRGSSHRASKLRTSLRGRMWVAFSGNARQAETAFHTEIHSYNVGGEAHYANATELSIPAELVGIVGAVRGLITSTRKRRGPRVPRAHGLRPSSRQVRHSSRKLLMECMNWRPAILRPSMTSSRSMTVVSMAPDRNSPSSVKLISSFPMSEFPAVLRPSA